MTLSNFGPTLEFAPLRPPKETRGLNWWKALNSLSSHMAGHIPKNSPTSGERPSSHINPLSPCSHHTRWFMVIFKNCSYRLGILQTTVLSPAFMAGVRNTRLPLRRRIALARSVHGENTGLNHTHIWQQYKNVLLTYVMSTPD
jgi:hypothetical protein